MKIGELGLVERRVLGALMVLSNSEKEIEANTTEIAEAIGYKRNGGSISSALKILQYENIITKIDKRRYKLLI